MARRLTKHRLPRHSSPRHWRGARLRAISRCVRTATNPCRHPRASFPRYEVRARSSWLEARVGCCCFQPAASSHTTNTHTPARVRIHSTLGLTIIVHDQPLRFSLSCRAPHAVPTTHGSRGTRHAKRLSFLLRGSHPFLGRPFFLSFCFALRQPLSLSACFALRRAPRPPARKNTLASAHTDDRRTNDATCGPQACLTGKLHDGGIRSVRSPPRRPPLPATPIAKPLQCGRP